MKHILKHNYSDSVLVTLADKNYVKQAKQLFSSVYWNAGWSGDYLLLSHEIPEKELLWFRKKGIIVFKCKPLWKEKYYGGMSSAVLDKFYLFTPYFKKWKHIIFLDADIIVKASLQDLTKKTGMNAVYNTPLKTKVLGNTKLDSPELRGYDMNSSGFNCGVLAIDTDIITSGTFKDLRNMIKKYSRVAYWGEELLINLYFYKKCSRLPRQYNMITPHATEKTQRIVQKKIKKLLETRAIIIHSAGNSFRLWEKGNIT